MEAAALATNAAPQPGVPTPRADGLHLEQVFAAVLVGRNRLLVAALSAVLAKTGPVQVVRTHARIEEAVAEVRRLPQRPDVLVVDHDGELPERATEVRAFREAWPSVRVVVTSVPLELPTVRAYVEAGAQGVLGVDAELEDLVSAIRSVVRGQAACSPTITALLLQALTARPTDPAIDRSSLTPRERQVVRLLERGMSNKEIARQLDIKLATVKNHVHNILSKLELSNRGRVGVPPDLR